MARISKIIRRRTLFRAAISLALTLPAMPATSPLFAQKPERLPKLEAAVDLPLPNVSAKAATQESLPAAVKANAVEVGLTLESLQGMAVANNPSLAQAWGQVVAAEGRYIQAGLPNNPSVGYSGQQLGGSPTEQHGVIMQQEFIRHKKLSTQQQSACHDFTAARHRWEAQRQRVLTDVRSAFFEMLIAQELISLNERLIDVARQSQSIAKRKYDAKEASQIDLLQSRIEADQARLALTRSEHRRDAAWRRLTALVGVPLVSRPVIGTLAHEPPPLNWEDAWGRLMSQSPELSAAESDVQRARWNLERQIVEPLPNVNLQGIVQYDQSVQHWDGAVQVMIPIAVRNRNQGGILQAEGELRAAENNVGRVRQQLEHRLAEVYRKHSDARAEVDRYSREILPAAAETLELVRRGYEAGEFDFDYVLAAQRTNFTALVNKMESLEKLHTTAAEIEGLLLVGSLEDRK